MQEKEEIPADKIGHYVEEMQNEEIAFYAKKLVAYRNSLYFFGFSSVVFFLARFIIFYRYGLLSFYSAAILAEGVLYFVAAIISRQKPVLGFSMALIVFTIGLLYKQFVVTVLTPSMLIIYALLLPALIIYVRDAKRLERLLREENT